MCQGVRNTYEITEKILKSIFSENVLLRYLQKASKRHIYFMVETVCKKMFLALSNFSGYFWQVFLDKTFFV